MSDEIAYGTRYSDMFNVAVEICQAVYVPRLCDVIDLPASGKMIGNRISTVAAKGA